MLVYYVVQTSFITGTHTSQPAGLSFKACVLHEPPSAKKTKGDLTIQNYSELPRDPQKSVQPSSYNAVILNRENTRLKQSLTNLTNLDYEFHKLERPSTLFFVDPNATYSQDLLKFEDVFQASLSKTLETLSDCVKAAGLEIKVIGANIAKLFAGLSIPSIQVAQNLAFIDLGSGKFTVTEGQDVNQEKNDFNKGIIKHNLYDAEFKPQGVFEDLLPKVAVKLGELFSPTNEREGLLAIAKHIVSLLNRSRDVALAKLRSVINTPKLIEQLEEYLKTDRHKIQASEIGTNGDKYGMAQVFNPQTDDIVFQAIQIVVAKVLAYVIKANSKIQQAQFIVQASPLTNVLSNDENKKAFLEEFKGSQLHRLSDSPIAIENDHNGAKVMATLYYQKQKQLAAASN